MVTVILGMNNVKIIILREAISYLKQSCDYLKYITLRVPFSLFSVPWFFECLVHLRQGVFLPVQCALVLLNVHACDI